ncbi:CBS domain-containing protein [Streptomyces xiangluensis]|uniref:CBS domain-containing protein n=1 Tax=Streptomyces xiangluensis TaxID=2665720 RepID=A0ABV8YHC7_9ACTN
MTTAREIMHTGAACIQENETLQDAARRMNELDVGALPICGEDDRLHMTADFDDSFTAGQPLPRFGEPEEAARMVLFIVADATFSTGVEFVLDGGVTAGPPTVLTPAR